MNDNELDRLLAQVPFPDEDRAASDDALKAWRDAATDDSESSRVGAILEGSAAARALLETVDREEDAVSVERARRKLFPTPRRWVVPVVAAMVLAAGLAFLVTRPGPPDYHAPTYAGQLKDTRSGDPAVDNRVYPPTGRIAMKVWPKQPQESAPKLAVYVLEGSTLTAVDATVSALDEGALDVEIEVSALPGSGPRIVNLVTVLGTDAGGFAGDNAEDALAEQPSRWFTAKIEISGDQK